MIVATLLVAVSAATPRDQLFDAGWRFYRGDVPVAPPPPPACAANTFPLQVGRCNGLTFQNDVADLASCMSTCCHDSSCTTYQWMAKSIKGGNQKNPSGCWLGDYTKLQCTKGDDGGYTIGGRNPAPPSPPTPPAPPPLPSFATPSFDDGTWAPKELPHDWSIEDLPAREDDTSVPVIEIRNGTWSFKTGDDASWSAAGFPDSNWPTVTVPHDWRQPPTSYEKTNATAWYRRNFTLTAKMMAAYRVAVTAPVLALGIAATTDDTYVNGVRIGGGNSIVQFRVYTIALSQLQVGQNSVAVRVTSPGGKATDPTATPGGLYDTLQGATSGVSVATGADWSPPSPFDVARTFATGAVGRSVGYSVGGVGWYRKTFKVDADASEHVSLRFDGVYMNVDMWINGVWLGNHPYGYTTFAYDLTPYLTKAKGGTNVIAVRVRNNGANSRWYSGSGIFRHVHLTTTPSLRIGLWGVTVDTPHVAPDSSMAVARVAVTLSNDGASDSTGGKVMVTIKSPAGDVVSTATLVSPPVPKGQSVDVVFDSLVVNGTAGGANLSQPIALWSVDTPSLYTATVDLSPSSSSSGAGSDTDTDTDTVTVNFGIRTLSFTSEGGFLLNGVPTVLKGGCVHHDNGALGSATIGRAEERRVETLKKNGYNAIRTSHNPVSPAFLDACDRLGMLVMDEAFDCWEKGKNHDDYHVWFDEWWQRDMRSMVKRDINHPSVILWSIGNEIPMRTTEAGYKLAKELADFVRAIDPTRPVTAAVPMVNNADEPFLEALDVGGYNYSPKRYLQDHIAYPERVIVGTESFPDKSFEMWQQYTNNSWVIGDFIWTAIDYIGESAIGSAATSPDLQNKYGQPWQWHISFCGDIDIMGMQKPQAFYRTVLWDAAQINMLVHHPTDGNQVEKVSGWGWMDERDSWNWDVVDGKPLQVRVFSKCSTESVPGPNANGTVSLTLNGKPVPGSPMQIGYATEFVAVFMVPYSKGTLEAKCTNLGAAAPTTMLTTAGAPVALKATADRSKITADRDDLSYITVEVVDAAGNRVPDSRERLTFSVSAGSVGEIQAVGTGDPTDVSSFQMKERVTYQGRAVAILRPSSPTKAGTITLTIKAADNSKIAPTTITVQVAE